MTMSHSSIVEGFPIGCEESSASGESSRGLPQSKTLRDVRERIGLRQLLECGSPLPLWAQGFVRRLALVVFVLLGIASAGARDVEVSAGIESPQAVVGEAVEFQIKVNGASNANVPQGIQVDGLEFRYVGPQSTNQISINNGKMTRFSGVVHHYQIVPQKEGEFTIPAIPVTVGSDKFETAPVKLQVSAGGSAAPGVGGNIDASVTLIPAKQRVYVGEAVPVEARVLVDSRVRWQLKAMPDIPSDGFTTQPWSQPQQGSITNNGTVYDAVTTRTMVTPVKSGTLALGPATADVVVEVPQQRRKRQRQDPFGMFDDFLNQNEMRQGKISGTATSMDVLPLPIAGRPAEFGESVGQFTLTAEAAPDKVKVGDPVTLKIRIKGRGNFDRVSAPVVLTGAGWRAYEPANTFEKDDEFGMSGVKTFEIALIPSGPAKTLPEARFVYFDPEKEKYETLSTGEIPVVVEGAAIVPTPVPDATVAAAPTPKPKVEMANDILYLRNDPPHVVSTLEPLWKTPRFWLWQLVPASVALALGVWRWRQSKASDAGLRNAERRRELQQILGRIGGGNQERAVFLEDAVRALRLAVALRVGGNPESIHLNEVTDLPEALRQVHGQREESLYAGAGFARSAVSNDEREKVMESLKAYAQ